jgi:CDP-diacylglycerol--glycerol-3-phosphate 3-phosphatidyltransferase
VNLPIALTLFRIVLVPLIMVYLISSSRVSVLIAAVIFVAASFTDWLDGRMARRWNQVTRLGTLLDPVADKLLVAAALVSLVHVEMLAAWRSRWAPWCPRRRWARPRRCRSTWPSPF